MFGYSLVHTPDFNIDTKVIDNILTAICKIVEQKQFWVLNIVFLNKKSVQELNKAHRGIDKPTDVLSFHYFDDFSELTGDDIAWEIILCTEILLEQAIEYWLGDAGEFYKLLIHSVLHILWYDHEKDDEYEIMHRLELAVASEVWITLG